MVSAEVRRLQLLNGTTGMSGYRCKMATFRYTCVAMQL